MSVVRDIKVHPELGRLLVRSGQDLGLRLWYLARLYDSEHTGSISVENLEQAARGFGGMKGRQFQNILKAGEGIFWQAGVKAGVGRVWITGLKKLCERFGVLPMQPVIVPLTCFATLESFRASLYAAWLETHREITISRETAAPLWGRQARTLQRWERTLESRSIAKVEKRVNIARPNPTAQGEVDSKKGRSTEQRFRENEPEAISELENKGAFRLCTRCGFRTRRPGAAEEHARQAHGAGEEIFTWAWQMPNTYTTDLHLAPWGQSRRIREELKSSYSEEGSKHEQGQMIAKLYYRKETSALKALKRGATRAYCFSQEETLIGPAGTRAVGYWYFRLPFEVVD